MRAPQPLQLQRPACPPPRPGAARSDAPLRPRRQLRRRQPTRHRHPRMAIKVPSRRRALPSSPPSSRSRARAIASPKRSAAGRELYMLRPRLRPHPATLPSRHHANLRPVLLPPPLHLPSPLHLQRTGVRRRGLAFVAPTLPLTSSTTAPGAATTSATSRGGTPRSFPRLSVPRSGAERRFYSRGGRHRRAAHWAVLSCLDVTHRKPTSKNRSHTREERKTRTAYAIQQKIAHVGLSAPHDGAQLKNADSGGPGSTRERRQGRRFGPRFKWLRRRHQNRLMGNSSSSAPFQKGSGLRSTQWMWVSTTSTSSSRRP